MKYLEYTTIVVMMLLAFTLGFILNIFLTKPRTCNDFATQSSAQKSFEKIPSLKDLDRNHDGIACNGLPK